MDAVSERMVNAARIWLDSLDAQQRERALWSFPSDDERRLWFYTPTDHGGLPIRLMSPPQQQGAMRLLSSGLSRAGYVTVATIMGLENVLDEDEGWRTNLADRQRARDPEMYFVRVFGEPGSKGAWSWRFGGHHVSINHLVVDGVVQSTTPCFMGADPASSQLLGPHFLRPLGAVEDLGRELVRSLDQAQFATALISPVAPLDTVSGNRPQVNPGDVPLGMTHIFRGIPSEPIYSRLAERTEFEKAALGLLPEHTEALSLSASPKGVSAAVLAGSQHEILRAVLDTYLGRMPDELAATEVEKYTGSAIESLHFSWAGGIEPGQPHYYRIEGPRLLVEYDNTQRNVNHIHSVWRDPQGDFGVDVLGDHYRASHDH